MRLITYSLVLLAAVSQAGLQVCASSSSSGTSNVVSSDGVRILRRTKSSVSHLLSFSRAGLRKSVVTVHPLLKVDSKTVEGGLADIPARPSISDSTDIKEASGTTSAPSSPGAEDGSGLVAAVPIHQSFNRRNCSPCVSLSARAFLLVDHV